MRVNTMRCKVCKGETQLHALGAMAGEEQGVRLSIEGMPAMQCPEGHKRFVAPDFAVKMMQALLSDEPLAPLDAAAQKGLLKKKYCCPKCGQALEAADGSVAAKRVLQLTGLEAFGVQVELPKLRCASCGQETVPPEKAVADGLMKASVNAFRAAEVEPI